MGSIDWIKRRIFARDFTRKRRRRLLAGATTITALMGVPAAVGMYAQFGGDAGRSVAGAVAGAAQSFADLINGRSPGARGEASLTTVKIKLPPAGERDMASPSDTPPNSGMRVIAAAPPLSESVPQFAPVEFAAQTPGLTFPPIANAVASPPIGGLFPSPGGGSPVPPGGGILIPPGTNVPPPPTVPGVIPEPETWAMMLLGFGLIGAGLRRRRTASTAKA